MGSVGTEITAGNHVFQIDEPASLAGDDRAASPVEVALGAFIACQIVVYRLYAQLLGISFDSNANHCHLDLKPINSGGRIRHIGPRLAWSEPHSVRKYLNVY